MKRSLFKALVPTVAMIMVAVLALSGVTYAWFTTSTKAEIGSFDLNVETADGLLISTRYNTGWKSTVSWSEITEANGSTTQKNNANIVLKAISTNGAVSDTHDIRFFTAAPADDSSMITGVQALTAGPAADGYLKFDLYFWNASPSIKTVNLGETSVAARTAEGNTGDGVEKAVRIGFVKQGVADMGSSVTNAGTVSAIFEPNAQSHTTAGINDYRTGHKLTALDNEKYEYYGVAAAAEDAAASFGRFNAKAAIYGGSDETDAEPTETLGLADTYFELAPNQVTKVSVYVWLEGQDADCLNDIADSSMTVDLKFDSAVK